MNIGLDAKRAFLNQSGLGNYSRTLIKSLVDYHPEDNYYLFTTKKTESDFASYLSEKKNVSVLVPEKLLEKNIPARWRSFKIPNILLKKNMDVYHGLSNELPLNIEKFKGKKVVTIHDLIFLHYPHFYSYVDRTIYNKKAEYACRVADHIIATSEQTKNDIIQFYNISSKKIHIIYQSCMKGFYEKSNTSRDNCILSKYILPQTYLLSIGTIEERKNLLTILKSLTIIKDIPLVVIGKQKPYFKQIKKYIHDNDLQGRVLFPKNILNEDMPSLYRNAAIFIYPSLYEGFGIPIIEAITSGTPVITTKGGCFTEAGGNDSIYIDPLNHEQLATEIKKLLSSSSLRTAIIEKGINHSKKFLPENIAKQMMTIYSKE